MLSPKIVKTIFTAKIETQQQITNMEDIMGPTLIIHTAWCRIFRLVCKKWNELLYSKRHHILPMLRPWTWVSYEEFINVVRNYYVAILPIVWEHFWPEYVAENPTDNQIRNDEVNLTWAAISKFGKTKQAIICYHNADSIPNDDLDLYFLTTKANPNHYKWLTIDQATEYDIDVGDFVKTHKITWGNILAAKKLTVADRVIWAYYGRVCIPMEYIESVHEDLSISSWEWLMENPAQHLDEDFIAKQIHTIPGYVFQLRKWRPEFTERYYDILHQHCEKAHEN